MSRHFKPGLLYVNPAQSDDRTSSCVYIQPPTAYCTPACLSVPHFVWALSAEGRLSLGFECRKSGRRTKIRVYGAARQLRSTSLALCPVLSLPLGNRFPAHVLWLIRATASKRNSVVDNKARARASRHPSCRAWVKTFESAPCCCATFYATRSCSRAGFATRAGIAEGQG
jgi:hypothetical protein